MLNSTEFCCISPGRKRGLLRYRKSEKLAARKNGFARFEGHTRRHRLRCSSLLNSECRSEPFGKIVSRACAHDMGFPSFFAFHEVPHFAPSNFR